MSKNNLKEIIESAIIGNEFPFNRFFEETFKKLLPKLTFLTKSEDDAQDLFLISMHKFWDRFVINQEELPHNSTGYIYIMCRNAWLRQKKPWNTVNIDDNASQKYAASNEKEYNINIELKIHLDDDLLKHKALSIALEQLPEKCKRLIESELNPEIRLKDLQEDLGYTNYQALVQAKYNCKKKLIKKIFEIIIDLKKNDPLDK